MTELSRSGSVLVAEIKANHGAGETNGSAIAGPGTETEHAASAVPETGASDSAPLVDPSIATPYPAAQSNGHAEAAPESDLAAGTGATAIQHEAQPSMEGAQSDVLPTAAGSEGAMEQPQVVPVQAISPSSDAAVSESVPLATSSEIPRGASVDHTGSAMDPTSATQSAAPGSVLTSTSPIQPVGSTEQAAVPQEDHSALAPVAAVAAPVAVGAGAAGVASQQTKPSTGPALSPKEIKKMDKLMKKEAKNESKSLKRAIKDAGKSEKLMRKSRDAEVQALKRHEKATTNEHKSAKALNKAKAEHEKCITELNKATEEMDIKKKHTATSREGYEKSKTQIDTLRSQKQANDRARIDRTAQIHGVGV